VDAKFHVDLDDESFFSGEKILLYYSHDKKNWSVWSEEVVKYNNDFGLYLEFEINHMTSFAVSKKEKEKFVYEEVIKDIDTNKDKKLIKDSKMLKDIELVSNNKKIKAKINKDTYIKNKNGEYFE